MQDLTYTLRLRGFFGGAPNSYLNLGDNGLAVFRDGVEHSGGFAGSLQAADLLPWYYRFKAHNKGCTWVLIWNYDLEDGLE